MLDRNGHYSLRAILGYGAKYNIVLSDRGRGKSFDAKHFLMRQEGTSMCLFRQSTDMHMAMMSWIEPLISKRKDKELYEIYSEEQFEWEGSDKEGYILKYNGTDKIWFRYLTQVNHIKQEVFPDDMNWVWLDEFIPLCYKKLPGIESEGDAIRTIIKTIEHDSTTSREEQGLKPVRMIMYANPFTWNNPILSYFKLRPIEGIHRIGPGVVMEYLPPLPIKKKGKPTVDDFLGNEVNTNQGWYDEMAFVDVEWAGTFVPSFSVRIDDKYFLCHTKANMNANLWVTAEKMHKGTSGNYVYDKWGSQDGLKEDEACLDGTGFLKLIKEKIRRGQMHYRDLNTKFDFQNAIASLR